MSRDTFMLYIFLWSRVSLWDETFIICFASIKFYLISRFFLCFLGYLSIPFMVFILFCWYNYISCKVYNYFILRYGPASFTFCSIRSSPLIFLSFHQWLIISIILYILQFKLKVNIRFWILNTSSSCHQNNSGRKYKIRHFKFQILIISFGFHKFLATCGKFVSCKVCGVDFDDT